MTQIQLPVIFCALTTLMRLVATVSATDVAFPMAEGESTSVLDQIKAVRQALDYVRSVESDTCTGGTGETLILNFDHDPWTQYTEPAIKTANFLSKILAMDKTLDRFDEEMFYAMVRNNVHGDTLIFGSAIAVQPGVLSGRLKYCPYAFRSRENGTVHTFDIAVNYDYRQNSTEWYHRLKSTDLRNITIVTDKLIFNESEPVNGTSYISQPVAYYIDGHWTYPYFDCGGGNIWMSTYSSPILSVDDKGLVTFSGVATIDIELTNLDINQCDLTESVDARALDVFRGTHNCHSSTSCIPLSEGFHAGAYLCECRDGFYFPNSSSLLKAYIGSDIEDYFESTNGSLLSPQFQCYECPRGCDTCVDATPCLYQINDAVQAFVVFVISIMITACIIIAIIIFSNRKQLVIKTASPIFLVLMCFGAMLMCSSDWHEEHRNVRCLYVKSSLTNQMELVFVMYGEVTTIACTIQIWPFHLGFTVMYGALLLKTWRISVIFKSGGTTKRVNLPDKALLQRMVPLVAVVTAYLAVWTAMQPPQAHTEKTSTDMKFFVCSMSWWTYAMYGADAVMLLVGVYLCFTVRKAPAHFNESKFITWATYNAIILGSFIMMLTQFVGMSVGPDVVIILMMAQQQVFVTITMALIFTPKFWALHRGVSGDGNSVYTNQVMTITGRVKPTLAQTSSRFSESVVISTRSAAVQCSTDDFLHTTGIQDDDCNLNHHTSSRPLSKHSAKVSPFQQDTLAPPPNGYVRP